MKKKLCLLAILVATLPVFAADVGLSVTIGEPGFYGQLELGDVQRPQLIYSRPIIVQQPQVRFVQQPLYLRVPPGHAKNWRRYCNQYHACDREVYFVQDRWYNEVYAPQIRERRMHDELRGERDEHGRRGDERNDHKGDRGNSHGHGRDHDRDRDRRD
ncbi:MAG: hypothetical protein KGM99_14880 [Burkholderiales bacterium]|nr:hypothetical protein [Burkholderiales bacterium]